MKLINGIKFYDVPNICGTCPASDGQRGSGSPLYRQPKMVSCLLFDLRKGFYASTPKRCRMLFEKAFTLPQDDLVIVITNPDETE